MTADAVLRCRGETGLAGLLDSYSAPNSADERARAAAASLGLDPSTDGSRQGLRVVPPQLQRRAGTSATLPLLRHSEPCQKALCKPWQPLLLLRPRGAGFRDRTLKLPCFLKTLKTWSKRRETSPDAFDRKFALGELLPPAPGGAQGWTLPQVVDRMRSAYCGTLAVELDHLYSSVCNCHAAITLVCRRPFDRQLQRPRIVCAHLRRHWAEPAKQSKRTVTGGHCSAVQQEQRAWLIEQVEGLRPLPRPLARRALQALVSADAFERFLASSFPASKVLMACLRFSSENDCSQVHQADHFPSLAAIDRLSTPKTVRECARSWGIA